MAEVIMERPSQGVGLVSINRPEKRNACNQRTWQLLADAFVMLSEDRSMRLAILSGVGGHFSAGDDIVAYNDSKVNPLAADRHRAAIRASYDAILKAPFPVIAAIEGACVGGAVSLAMCCDFRVAHPSARICIPVAKLGLVYPTAHIQRLVQLVGASNARRWLYTAAFINGTQAEKDGFVDALAVDDVRVSALEFGQSMLDLAPLSIAGSKLQINAICNGTVSLEQNDIDAKIAQAESSEDYQAAVRAFRDKSTAVFMGL